MVTLFASSKCLIFPALIIETRAAGVETQSLSLCWDPGLLLTSNVFSLVRHSDVKMEPHG